MDKMIFRTQPSWAFSSNLTHEFCNGSKSHYRSLKEIVDDKGYAYIIKEICEDTVSFDVLCEEFERFLADGTSELFTYAVRLNEHYAVSLDSNIYLYRFSPEDILEQQAVFQWQYATVRKYIGDTWWYNDSEIIADIQQMSLLEFLEKYKGYVG